MSHLKLRTEKNCLNCGTSITDRYCTHCGQENIEPKESLWHLFIHFFEDITHFDGKFFSTIKLLLLKPGFLTEAYMKGKRASYLNPIRMYLFVSFLLFLVEFSLPNLITTHTSEHNNADRIQLHNDSNTVHNDDRPIDTIARGVVRTNSGIEMNDDAWINEVANNYQNVHEYDSVQKALPVAQRDGKLSQFIARGVITFIKYGKEHPQTWADDFKSLFVHSIPKMLFTSIPIFAFLLWMLYFRKRKDYYFVAHGIFTIHLYCAIFVLLILFSPLTFLKGGSFVIAYLTFALLITVYRYIAMKRFYKQGHLKTILKFLLLSFFSTIVFLIIIVAFIFNTVLVLGNSGVH